MHQTNHFPTFAVTRADTDGVLVLVVAGEVELATLEPLHRELASLPPNSLVVVDLCDVDFMDSSGLRVLLVENMQRPDRVFVACMPAGPLMRLFQIAGVTAEQLRVYGSRAEAVAAAKAAS